MLDVGDGHWVYVEEVGQRNGISALFLHGGPGSGCQHGHRVLFDRKRFHAILFDQRGAGRSHPYLSRRENTTDKLVCDIERIREHFSIDKWLVVGGSWGSTLALAYGQAHPERVSAMVLRAVFLGSREEISWAFIEGPRRFRPELYEAFVSFIPVNERSRPLESYVARLLSDDLSECAPAAQMWSVYERALSELNPAIASLPKTFDIHQRVPPTALMEAHYIKNDFFLEPHQLLENSYKLRGIPGAIIQGRYDLLCPPAQAYALTQGWPDCKIQFMETAGHSWSEQGVVEAMHLAVNELA